jgi:hypothetical protein
MPEALWREAESCAARLGLHAVARYLGLNHASLRKRCSALSLPCALPTSAPAFVEVAIDASVPFAGCSVEIVRTDGARMAVRTGAGIDVVALSAAFLNSGR